MKPILIFLVWMVIYSNLYSQNTINKVLNEIEKNNTTLLSIRKNSDAEKIANKTGLFPQNPEVEFNYLWGNPSSIGNRTDFSVRQSFDFPTAYKYRNQLSYLKNGQVELEYQKQRKEILQQSRLVCLELVYQNALKTEFTKRLYNATHLARAYKAKFDRGDVGILVFNKAQVNMLNISKEVEINEIKRNELLSILAGFNGGIGVHFTDSVFDTPILQTDFEEWYALAEQKNPVLQWIKQEIVVGQKQKQLGTAMSLPKLNAGYMSEKVVGQQFQGITAGLSIPLWENKNTLKYAKVKTIALQSVELDAKVQFYTEMKTLHSKATAMQISVMDYRNKLLEYSNDSLLQKALNKGEISLSEYIMELALYYESFDKLMEMEFNLNKTLAELYRYQ